MNREGIEHKAALIKLRRVLWRDVESCTFSTSRNAAGSQMPASLVLKGRVGTPLLNISVPEQQAAQLLPAIRFYLRGPESEESSQAGKAL